MLPLVRLWTPDEIEKLRTMALAGASSVRCGAALKRTSTSVRVKARAIGAPFQTRNEVRKRLKDAEAKVAR